MAEAMIQALHYANASDNVSTALRLAYVGSLEISAQNESRRALMTYLGQSHPLFWSRNARGPLGRIVVYDIAKMAALP